MDPAYAEALELVYLAYEKSLDLEVAFAVVPLGDGCRERLSADPRLAARVALCEARVKEELMDDFRTIAKTSANDGVRLAALKELGRVLYPKRFKETLDVTVNDVWRVIPRKPLAEAGDATEDG